MGTLAGHPRLNFRPADEHDVESQVNEELKINKTITFRRFSNTLLPLFIATLLLFLSSVLAADELSQALLKNRIQAIQKSGNSVEIATTLGVYEEALSWLRETEAQNQSAAGYNKALESSP